MPSALVPFVFSLLNLPHVALKNVADCWNPYETFNFSLTSKKSKQIAKSIARKGLTLGFEEFPFLRVNLIFPKRNRQQWNIHPNQRGQIHGVYVYSCKKPEREVLKIMEHAIEIFKIPSMNVFLTSKETKRTDIISWLTWCSKHPIQLTEMCFLCYSENDLDLFFNNYWKSTRKVRLGFFFNAEREFIMPKNTAFSWIDYIRLGGVETLNINILKFIDSSRIDLYFCQGTNQDLNSILKSWQAGFTNQKMRTARFQMENKINLSVVLEGLSAEFKDPRTVKRNVRFADKSFWVFGGIDIRRVDGTIGTVQWASFRTDSENFELPLHWINRYEESKKMEAGEKVQEEDNEFDICTLTFLVW